MSINKVSFGSIITVKYRYNANDSKSERQAFDKYRRDNLALQRDPSVILSNTLDIQESENLEDGWGIYKYGNRIITGDDKETVTTLYNRIGKKAAEEYENRHSETLIIDV